MKMPKYKPTKWKLKWCLDCNRPVKKYDRCNKGQDKHNVVDRPNVPFLVPDLKVNRIGYKGWAFAESKKTKSKYSISPSNFEEFITKHGIEPGGMIKNKWWMYAKLGSSLSLKHLPDD